MAKAIHVQGAGERERGGVGARNAERAMVKLRVCDETLMCEDMFMDTTELDVYICHARHDQAVDKLL
jgi:hypothetical protein